MLGGAGCVCVSAWLEKVGGDVDGVDGVWSGAACWTTIIFPGHGCDHSH